MSDDDTPEADRLLPAPHPRMTELLIGQEAAEAEILRAVASGKVPHAWLLTGPRGIGKATLAWKMAQFFLTDSGEHGIIDQEPSDRLEVATGTTLAARIRALSEPRLLLIRRSYDTDRKRLKTQITVDEVRKLNGFFGLSVTDGGRRVVVLDSADEMNPSAANALLKVLEEPPRGAILILTSHQPARLLPTIRSRCRVVRLRPLSHDDLRRAALNAGVEESDLETLSSLAGGSVGEAVRLAAGDGVAIYQRLISLIESCPRMDRSEAIKLTETATARGSEEKLELLIRLLDLALSELARAGFAHTERETFARLSPSPDAGRAWAALQQDMSARIAHARAVNIDPQAMLLDAFLRINETAERHTAHA